MTQMGLLYNLINAQSARTYKLYSKVIDFTFTKAELFIYIILLLANCRQKFERSAVFAQLSTL